MKYTLRNVDPEDLGDMFSRVQRSFNFQSAALADVKTFGEFCGVVKDQLPISVDHRCTYQHAFYTLRSAIRLFGVEGKLSPDTRLQDIGISESRTSFASYLDSALGFKSGLLRLGTSLQVFCVIFFISSLAFLPINYWYSLLFVIVCFAISRFGKPIQSEFSVLTLGDLARKLSWENYVELRRSTGAVNQDEINSLLTAWFASEFDLDKSELTADARFY